MLPFFLLLIVKELTSRRFPHTGLTEMKISAFHSAEIFQIKIFEMLLNELIIKFRIITAG
ncbi:MAG: hypothetical protein A2418_00330 [Candidatus Brennerbacteria bacterium RIFOXYC1_FULL_41_11]|uniref:Uncharacterized protein n=1 Tax=Candidatus Brennerbacteria bacterium RIFOXYD1_FULL_41_16 TaxID=1797529 RepID=A0A1G1XLW1_9BACT|nr:MAG: hypothetical protein A2391_01790 [Candidatus Brennerbacteria bacterium RIFOXYB1_FULL_41_13]OGY39683.1 MAG: hypothetical protein A2418_00330 [Candidatus Brennerbacteria bacterium RIFOXYC1_FULL_41_11]OGY40307.1 MAG: hypothetical protein A2570_03455 [Candidatus Brennerbacteria bacterium RIFOXYD1_FULL_41_16]